MVSHTLLEASGTTTVIYSNLSRLNHLPFYSSHIFTLLGVTGFFARNIIGNIPCVLSLIWLFASDYRTQIVDLEGLGQRDKQLRFPEGLTLG